uniref:Uncharacterized protein n=1 Tax=Rhizophora mucronata TaxID=61149 RepID=A0A2P2Q1Q7_RHIMU
MVNTLSMAPSVGIWDGDQLLVRYQKTFCLEPLAS